MAQKQFGTRRLNLVDLKYNQSGYFESGGLGKNSGKAVIIADQEGLPPRALKIFDKGELACKNHALIPLQPGFHIIEVENFNFKKETIKVWKVEYITEREKRNHARLKLIHSFSHKKWDKIPKQELSEAIAAAKKKSLDFHCKVPFFVS